MPGASDPRRLLYKQQLDQVESHLSQLAAKFPKLATALGDRGLIEALVKVLDPFVVYGVERDLRKLRKTGYLFATEPQSPACLSATKPLDAARRVGDPKSVDAYQRYFDWLIAPDDVTGGLAPKKSGVFAFYERYPLLSHAVLTATQNYKSNLELACERVAADWGTIEQAFFLPSFRAESLFKITTTGNDFHKGGKQVLILTFRLDSGATQRVVYKPSPVEMDCRIVGDSAIVNVVAPKGMMDSAGYQQTASLSEIINQFRPTTTLAPGCESRDLPTYRILPFNRTSLLDSYGYLEFLTREPEIEIEGITAQEVARLVGAQVRAYDPGTVRRSDWIVADPNDALVFFHQWGSLMALALAISLTDLHPDNVITHDRRPHLIDLEDAFKRPMHLASETLLPGTLDAASAPTGLQFQINGPGTENLSGMWLGGYAPAAKSALYLSDGRRATVETATDDQKAPLNAALKDALRNRWAVLAGFEEVVAALATPACNDAVKAWIGELDRTLTRFVPRPTVEFANSFRSLYTDGCERSTAELQDEAGYAGFVVGSEQVSYFHNQLDVQRGSWRRKLTPAPPPAWPLHPYFALEHPEHAWRDYLNGDIPSFYHRLGSRELLNSNDKVVRVSTAVEWQDRVLKSKLDPQWQAPALVEYFPQTPTAMLRAQLEDLKTRYAAGPPAFIAGALEDLKWLRGAAGVVMPHARTGS